MLSLARLWRSHGRGLIDVMAWFGCKGPLRKAIIQDDKRFPTASTIVDFLQVRFEEDITKKYYIVDDQKTACTRMKQEREAFPLRGCKSSHLISFHTDGSVDQKLSLKNLDVSFNVEEVADVVNSNDIDNDDSDENINDNEDIISQEGKLDLIEMGSFVAIIAPAGSLELFFVMKIIKKGIAPENMCN